MTLEDKISNLQKRTKEMIDRLPDAYFKPVNVPYYKRDLQTSLRRWTVEQGKRLPKGFWTKTKKQLLGMYYGIVIWQNRKKAFYTDFLFEYEHLMKRHTEESDAERLIRLNSTPQEELEREYEAAINFKNHLRAVDGYPDNTFAKVYGIE